jgi:uncharacterized repeat protein (TIGR03803 family)
MAPFDRARPCKNPKLKIFEVPMRSIRTSLCGFLSLATLLGAGTLASAQSFTLNDLANPNYGQDTLQYGIMEASDGNFYLSAASNTYVIKITPAGSISVGSGQLSANCGTDTLGTFIEGPDGNLYGFTQSGGGFFKYNFSTHVCSVIYSPVSSTDGYQMPGGPLTLGSDGNFYGVFQYGGASNYGTAFRLTPSGTFSILYTFTDGNDGGYPVTSLLEASDGNFYGLTTAGGANYGVVYKLTPGATVPWVETPIYNLSTNTGYEAIGTLVQADDSNIYGVVSAGAGNNHGSIFQLDLQGDYSDFLDLPLTLNGSTYNPYTPNSGLRLGSNGDLYGELANGGPTSGGGLYEVTLGGTYTGLATFPGSTATNPYYYPGGLFIQATDGDFYGIAQSGGTKSGGAVWQGIRSPAIAAPIQVTLSGTTLKAGGSVTVSWKVLNVVSNTSKQCYAYTQTGGGTFTGKLSGSISGTTMSGTAKVTPSQDGTFTYSVECEGNHAGVSPTLTVTGAVSAPTSTTLAVTPNPANLGQNVSLTSTVVETSGSNTPTGTVTFSVEGLALATVTLNSSGVGKYTASTASGVPVGTYPVVATYNGDSSDNTSTSNAVNVTVKNATTTTLSVSPNPVTQSQNVTLTSTVTQATGKGTPTGTVSFLAGTAVLATANLSNGTATLTAPTSSYPTGTYPVTARYNGNSSDGVSTSTVVDVTLNK